MAHPKNPPKERSILEYLHERAERIKALPLVDERFFVLEITPSRIIDHHWDTWSQERRQNVSGPLKTQEAVDAWLDWHDPEPGNKFTVVHEYLRTHTENRWGRV